MPAEQNNNHFRFFNSDNERKRKLFSFLKLSEERSRKESKIFIEALLECLPKNFCDLPVTDKQDVIFNLLKKDAFFRELANSNWQITYRLIQETTNNDPQQLERFMSSNLYLKIATNNFLRKKLISPTIRKQIPLQDQQQYILQTIRQYEREARKPCK